MTDFWQGKRVCVMGGAGFLGSHLVEQLLARQARVCIIDNHERGHNAYPGTLLYKLDIIKNKSFGPALAEFEPEVVFNLAATVAGVLYNQTHNAEMYADNMALQSIPVQACSMLQTPRFVQISSVCVYAPEFASGALEENGQAGEPVQANNGYAWAKRMGERVVLWSDLPHAVIMRPSNMYGPRDYFDDRAHVIPALIKKCLFDDVIKVHGTGREEREFLYVEDAARGLLAAAEYGRNREVYNLGTNGRTKTTIAMLVSLIQELTLMQDKPVEFTGGDAGDKARWSVCRKARNDLNFESTRPLISGLIETIKWYEADRLINKFIEVS